MSTSNGNQSIKSNKDANKSNNENTKNELAVLDSTSLLHVVDELIRLRATISQIQASLKQLLQLTPTLDRYKQLIEVASGVNGKGNFLKFAVDRLNDVLFAPQLKVAIRLKLLFESLKLTLLQKLCDLNFKNMTTNDRALDEFMLIVPWEGKSDMDQQKAYATGVKIDEAHLLPYPPILPEIKDQKLLIRVTTDKLYRQLIDFVELPPMKFNNSHNSKLAMRGKNILNIILFELLDEQLQDEYLENLLYMQKRLTSRELLAKFAMGYNLIDWLKYNLSQEADVDEKIDIMSNVFLAYIAGLQEEKYSLDSIREWVKKLYAPIINDLIGTEKPLQKVAMAELESLFRLATNLNNLSYKELDLRVTQIQSDPFVVQISLDNVILGLGTSLNNFDEAQDKAAMGIIGDKAKVAQIFTMIMRNYVQNSERLVEHGSTGVGKIIYPQISSASETCISPNLKKGNELDAEHNSYPVVEEVSLPLLPTMNHHAQPGNLIAPDAYLGQSVNATPNQLYPFTYELRFPDFQQHQQQHQQQYQQQYQQQSQQQINEQFMIDPITNVSNIPTIPLTFENVDMLAKNTFYAILGPLQLKANYEDKQVGLEFHSVCLLNGVKLGYGIDRSKQRSSQKAAMAAMSNRNELAKLGVHIK